MKILARKVCPSNPIPQRIRENIRRTPKSTAVAELSDPLWFATEVMINEGMKIKKFVLEILSCVSGGRTPFLKRYIPKPPRKNACPVESTAEYKVSHRNRVIEISADRFI